MGEKVYEVWDAGHLHRVVFTAVVKSSGARGEAKALQVSATRKKANCVRNHYLIIYNRVEVVSQL